MSKPKSTQLNSESSELPILKSYSMVRKQGAFALVEFLTQGEKLISVKQISEPDMRPITEGKLLIKMQEV